MMLGPSLLVASIIAGAPAIDPIWGGEPVDDDSWRSTVFVSDGSGGLCSGTLVTERLVLTAAHCLPDSPRADRIQIELGNDHTAPERLLPVESYALHPDFCPDIEACGEDLWDFAYVVLAEAAPADAVAPSLPLDQATWDHAAKKGAPLVLVGFGYDERGTWGLKRAVEVALRTTTDTGLELLAGGEGKDTCNGDSGGSAFGTTAAGEAVLVGVTSRGKNCGDGGYYGATPPALCWMAEELDVPWGTAPCEIDVTPEPEDDRGCSVGARPRGATEGPWAWLVVIGLGRRARARRARSR